MSLKKDMAALVKAAEEAGARLDDRGEKVLVFCPDGQTIVTIHKTPSDQRALRNARSELRKGGLDL